MRSKRMILAIATTAIATMVLGACSSSGDGANDTGSGSPTSSAGNGESPDKLTPVKFRTEFLPNGMQAPYYVAKALGYFEDEGLDVTITPGKGSQLTIDDVLSGGSDIGLAATPNVILSVAAGQEVTAVASTIGINTYGFMFPVDSGIKTVEDLKGKTIISTAGTPQSALLPVVLKAHGLSTTDVKIQNVDAAAQVSTYVGGVGDALVTATVIQGPFIQARRASVPLTFADAGVPTPEYSLVVNSENADSEANMETYRKFVSAVLKGIQYSIDNPADAAKIMVEAESSLAVEDVETVLTDYRSYYCSPGADGKPLGFSVADEWNSAAEALHEGEAIKSVPAPDSYFTNEFFEGDDALNIVKCPLS